MRRLCTRDYAAVQAAVLIEHGCEKTHNDHFQQEIGAALPTCDLDQLFGWFSLQLGGGLDKVCSLATSMAFKVRCR